MIYIFTSWSRLILRQESFSCLHLVRLGEAWWLMPKVGEAGRPRGDARQLLLLIGDEGTWIHLIQNDGIVRHFGKYASEKLVHLDSCPVCISQTPF